VWRSALGYFGLGLAGLGAILLKVLLGWIEMGVALLLVVVGAGVFFIATSAKRRRGSDA
jgi:hypothetical protein